MWEFCLTPRSLEIPPDHVAKVLNDPAEVIVQQSIQSTGYLGLRTSGDFFWPS